MTKDMTQGSPLKLILAFAVPLMLGSLFQQFYNLADTIIVGRFVGVEALAAVGSVGGLNYLVLGFVNGIACGFSIPISWTFGAKDYKANKKAIHAELEQQAQELLAQMGLSARAGHYPHQLSGGQQQRVAIARALALHPDILCFDEPTSALDPELTGEVLRVLRDLADRKTTMIIVTHEMHFARDVADRIMFMDGGVVVEEGPAKQLIEHPQEERTKQFLSHYGE